MHTSHSSSTEIPLIPLKDFFRKPEKANFQISPDGNTISYLAPWQSRMRMNIFIQPIESIHKLGEARQVTNAEARDITSYFWKSNRYIVYLQDKGGDENYHLYLVDLQTSEIRDLTPFDKVKATVVDDLPDIDDQMLIGLNQRDPKVRDVYRIFLPSGKMELVAENPGNVIGWLTDHDGKLRVGVATDGTDEIILYRATEKDPFKQILKTDFRTSVSPVLFTYDNKLIYAFSNLARDKEALVLFDPATGKEKEVLFEHPEVDASRLSYSDHRKVITSVAYTKAFTEFHFFDKQTEELQCTLQSKLQGVEVRVADMSRNEKRMIVATFSDIEPSTYYFYDTDSKNLVLLARTCPWLDSEKMAPTVPIRYTARDGEILQGYLTLPGQLDPELSSLYEAERMIHLYPNLDIELHPYPFGKKLKQSKFPPLPLIVNPHGGPHARDYWTFDREAQFLANRGYIVLKINFRGSTGFGRKFWEAGFKEWGQAMQNDLTDGVQLLEKEGIVDSKRVAIYGGSYGGYAALAGLTFTPDLYACGVSYVGPSNLFTLLASIPPYWEPLRAQMYEKIGHPEKEKELLTKISPYFHADKIKAPLLVAQGANDPRVKKAESDQIVSALRTRGIDVPYMVKANEGHGFQNEENQMDFYRALEAFLAKYLGGRAEPESANVLEPLFQTPATSEPTQVK